MQATEKSKWPLYAWHATHEQRTVHNNGTSTWLYEQNV